jgi:monoamine oxidase
MRTEVLIIGGGLSGLHTAYECHKRGIEYLLLEARDRLGGRVLSLNVDDSEYNPQLAAFDLGPSWFWPGQKRMHSLLAELGLENDKFFQTGSGDAVYEDNQGNIQRGIDGVSMSGAYRLKSGIRQLITAVSEQLSSEAVLCGAAVSDIKFTPGNITSTFKIGDSSKEISSKRVVLALPPRVALKHINFEPAFSDGRMQQLNDVATWMAGHAKLVCVFEQRFWQQQGFSGDVISHHGPLQEIHDASSEDKNLNALFGFVGIQAIHRKNRQDELKRMSITQLARVFGEQALYPKAIYLQDWAMEPYTSTPLDQKIQRFHPANNIGSVSERSWDGNLIWSGSESSDYSQQNNGLLEGALEASMRAISLLKCL